MNNSSSRAAPSSRPGSIRHPGSNPGPRRLCPARHQDRLAIPLSLDGRVHHILVVHATGNRFSCPCPWSPNCTCSARSSSAPSNVETCSRPMPLTRNGWTWPQLRPVSACGNSTWRRGCSGRPYRPRPLPVQRGANGYPGRRPRPYQSRGQPDHRKHRASARSLGVEVQVEYKSAIPTAGTAGWSPAAVSARTGTPPGPSSPA